MVDDHAVALFKAPQSLALLHDDAAGFMAGNGSVNIALRAFSGMFPVDAADIAAADRGGHRLDEYLAVPWLRDIKLLKFHCAVARERCSDHFTFHYKFSFNHVLS